MMTLDELKTLKPGTDIKAYILLDRKAAYIDGSLPYKLSVDHKTEIPECAMRRDGNGKFPAYSIDGKIKVMFRMQKAYVTNIVEGFPTMSAICNYLSDSGLMQSYGFDFAKYVIVRCVIPKDSTIVLGDGRIGFQKFRVVDFDIPFESDANDKYKILEKIKKKTNDRQGTASN